MDILQNIRYGNGVEMLEHIIITPSRGITLYDMLYFHYVEKGTAVKPFNTPKSKCKLRNFTHFMDYFYKKDKVIKILNLGSCVGTVPSGE